MIFSSKKNIDPFVVFVFLQKDIKQPLRSGMVGPVKA